MKKVINFDGILSFFMIAATAWVDYTIYIAGSVPFKWRISAIAIISIIALLCILLSIKRLPSWAIWVRRFVCLIIIIALGFGSIYISKVVNVTKGVTNVKDASELISVVVKNDSSIKKLSQLKNKKIGINTLSDKSNSNYVKKKLDKEVENIKYVKDNNYIDLANSLLEGDIDALILSNSYINSPSIEDSIPNFSINLRSLKSYERITNKASEFSGNEKLDLTKDNFSILLSGMDDTGSPNHNSRSDVNMLILVNPKTRFVQMISFPRDAYLPNPALNNGNDKLTHTGNDGVTNTMRAIENVVGFSIDFYVKVNFTSLLEIVNTLDGVEVDVPYSFVEQNSKRIANTVTVDKGKQILDGEEALAFSRHRYDGVGDIGRTKAQQMVLSAIIQKSMKSPSKVPDLLDIAPKYMVTNISNSQLESFISYQLEDIIEKKGHWKTFSYSLENGYNANLMTASMGSQPLSCNVLNRSDVELIFQKYEAIFNPKKLKDFKFDLSDMEKHIAPSTLQSANNVVFSDENFMQFAGEEEPEETPTIPEETVPPEPEIPDVPETPEVPDVPETPEVPDTPTPPTPDNPGTGGNGGGTSNP